MAAAGWTNVSFHHGELDGLEPGDDFDAVIGRWILMYVPQPADLLRRARGWLRPGGVVAFQEGDLRGAVRPYPPAPFHEQARRWTTPPPGAPGPEIEMGLKLFATYIEAGLGAPHLRFDAPIGGGPNWPGYAYLAGTLRSLVPFLEQIGAVASGEVDVETIEDRLRDEVVAHNGIQILPALIGAWARRSTGGAHADVGQPVLDVCVELSMPDSDNTTETTAVRPAVSKVTSRCCSSG